MDKFFDTSPNFCFSSMSDMPYWAQHKRPCADDGYVKGFFVILCYTLLLILSTVYNYESF